MSAGFEVTNSDNVILVDENFLCLSLRAKGLVTANQEFSSFVVPGGAGDHPRYADITYSGGDSPLVAIYKPQINGRTDMGGGIMGSSRGANGVWTFRVMMFGNANLGAIDYSFTYYIFDRPPPQPSTGGYGAEVYNGAGALVFSSYYPPMRTMNPTASSYPSGKYAISNGAGVSVTTDTHDEIDSYGNITYWEVYTVTASGSYVTPTGLASAQRIYSDIGRGNYNPVGVEAGATGGNLVINVAGL